MQMNFKMFQTFQSSYELCSSASSLWRTEMPATEQSHSPTPSARRQRVKHLAKLTSHRMPGQLFYRTLVELGTSFVLHTILIQHNH